jgi:hypothetical protein
MNLKMMMILVRYIITKIGNDMKIISIVRGYEQVNRMFGHFADAGVKDRAWIGGGFARWCADRNDNPPVASDIDVFCDSREKTAQLHEYFNHYGTLVRNSETAWTFDMPDLPPVQLIVWRDDMLCASDWATDFDFSVCRAVIVDRCKVKVDDMFEQDTRDMVLRLQRISNPVGAMLRIAKYAKKGYTISPAECSKILRVFNEAPLLARSRLLSEWESWDRDRWEQVQDDEPQMSGRWDDERYY